MLLRLLRTFVPSRVTASATQRDASQSLVLFPCSVMNTHYSYTRRVLSAHPFPPLILSFHEPTSALSLAAGTMVFSDLVTGGGMAGAGCAQFTSKPSNLSSIQKGIEKKFNPAGTPVTWASSPDACSARRLNGVTFASSGLTYEGAELYNVATHK